jgi:hypothetical protein
MKCPPWARGSLRRSYKIQVNARTAVTPMSAAIAQCENEFRITDRGHAGMDVRAWLDIAYASGLAITWLKPRRRS